VSGESARDIKITISYNATLPSTISPLHRVLVTASTVSSLSSSSIVSVALAQHHQQRGINSDISGLYTLH